MWGQQIGTLELIIDYSTVLWYATGKQENRWLRAEVKLPLGAYLVNFHFISFFLF